MRPKHNFFVYGILVLAIIGVIFLISGCTSQETQLKSPAAIDLKSVQDCQALDHEEAKKVCLRNLALKKHDSAYCIKEDYTCLSNLAQLIKDEKLCEIPTSEELKELGKRDQDIEILSISRDQCLLNVALNANNIKICDKISNMKTEFVSVTTEQCKKLLNQVIDCDATQEISKQNCYAYQAQVQLNPTLCDKISNPPIQEICKGQVYRAASVFQNDMLQCNLIQNLDQKDSCIIGLSVLNNDEEICLKTSEKNQNSCFQQFASTMLKPNVCSRINPKGNITKLQAESQKDGCFISLASGRKEKDLCNKITNPDTRDRCFKLLKEFGIE